MIKFGHPRLLVDKFSECFLFYLDVIGLKVTWGHENDSYASFANQDEKEVVLALFDRQTMAETVGADHLPMDTEVQDRVALIFNVDDVNIEADRIKSRGTQLVAGPKDFPGWGIRSTYLRDPDGNLLELYTDLAREEWTEGLQEAAKKHGTAD
ncbi:MAG: VOC family protein [Anaerolineales bacterium]|nr:VOC family protein [Anaerolineales bacterium]